MFRTSILLIYIFASATAFAALSDDDTSGMDRFSHVERASIAELIPDFEDMSCTPKCEGEVAACGEITEMNSCLETGRELGCFWSCK